MLPVDERRADAHVVAPVDEARVPTSCTAKPSRGRRLDVGGGQRARCPRVSTSAGVTREPKATVARMAIFAAASAPRHVLGRVGLGVAQPLRLRQRLGVVRAGLHAREDEVRRAVDDPEDAVHVGDDERLAQHLDHGDRRADASLEAQLDAGLGRGGEELGAAPRDELLVRRDDRLAGARGARALVARRRRRRPSPRRRRRSRVVEDRGEVGREHARAGAGRPARGRDRGRAPARRGAGGPSRARCRRRSPPSNRSTADADCAVAEQGDRNVDGGVGVEHRLASWANDRCGQRARPSRRPGSGSTDETGDPLACSLAGERRDDGDERRQRARGAGAGCRRGRHRHRAQCVLPRLASQPDDSRAGAGAAAGAGAGTGTRRGACATPRCPCASVP